jgi:HemK-like putative methylase
VIAEILTHEEELPAILPEELTPATIKRCLDLCTGSAALALILADIFPRAKVDGVDISFDALEVAKKNVKEFDAADRVQLIHSDMFGSIEPGTKYDIIVSNPPYVTQKARNITYFHCRLHADANLGFSWYLEHGCFT